MQAKRWSVEIVIDERDRKTRAEARLHTNDETSTVGIGRATRNPHDTDVPEIGDELAVARALADLAHKLVKATAADIETVTHQPAHLVE